MNFFSEERNAELREIFFESALELLQAMNEAGLELEERPDDLEVIRRVRRAVHTLKGDSAACGFRELSELAHQLEDVLKPDLAGGKNSPLAEVVLTAADTFHTMLAAYRGNVQPPDGKALRDHIHLVLSRVTQEPPPQVPAGPVEGRFEWNPYEQRLITEAVRQSEQVYHVAAEMNPDNDMPAPAIQLVRTALEACGRILAFRPAENEPLQNLRLVEAAVASKRARDWVERKCLVPGVVRRAVVKRAAAPKPAPHDFPPSPEAPEPAPVLTVVGAEEHDAEPLSQGAEAPAKAPSHASAAAIAESTLRVDAARIDNVMNLVGELIIGKSMLHRTLHEFSSRYAKDPLHSKMADALAFQSRVLGDLQRSVMKIRMVAVDNLFRRFPRIVRDVAKLQNKEIGVEVSGQNTDLDKGILDALADPLAHLVRNAADHGIETPEERVAAGKPPRGTICLGAYHQGNHVVIEIMDDGRGLDREKILERALESGLVTTEEASRLTEEEVYELIFRPGLTTADKITEVSGRGVGMDVVHSVMQELKGNVTIQSQKGKGTTFLLMVPLTLASIQALLFRTRGKLYAVPLASVLEITRISDSDVHSVDGHEVIRLRDHILSLMRLDVLENLPPAPRAHQKLFVIVMSAGSRRFGLVVEGLMGEEELVMKAIQDRLVSSELVSGASILGDGTVVLILNVAAIAAHSIRTPVVGAIA